MGIEDPGGVGPAHVSVALIRDDPHRGGGTVLNLPSLLSPNRRVKKPPTHFGQASNTPRAGTRRVRGWPPSIALVGLARGQANICPAVGGSESEEATGTGDAWQPLVLLLGAAKSMRTGRVSQHCSPREMPRQPLLPRHENPLDVPCEKAQETVQFALNLRVLNTLRPWRGVWCQKPVSQTLSFPLEASFRAGWQ